MTASFPHLPDSHRVDPNVLMHSRRDLFPSAPDLSVAAPLGRTIAEEAVSSGSTLDLISPGPELAEPVASAVSSSQFQPSSEPNPGEPEPVEAIAVPARSSFSSLVAPLTQDTFKQVVTDVEQKLRVVNQTLSILDNVLDCQGFDAILKEMLRSITLKTGELLNADRTTIFLLDEDRDELWSIVAKDDSSNNLELRFPKTVGIAGEVATRKTVINIPYDFYQDARSLTAQEFDRKNQYRTYTMLALPLLDDQGNLVAVVQLLNKLKPVHDPAARLEDKIDLRGFNHEDEQIFRDFAPSIRLILESSRSFYKAMQQQRAASALMKATKALSQSSLDLEETLSKVMDEAQKLMQADRSTLWLLDREQEQLWTRLLIDGELREHRIPMGAGFAGQVALTGEPVLIPFDLYDHSNAETAKETDQTTGYRTCSMLCMPVFNADGELIAVTQLINKRKQGDFPPYDPATYPEVPECWKASFNRNDQEFMKAFNIQAGIAIQNAKLFETVKQQEQMQRDILRSLSNAVISTDREGRIVAANASASRLLGLPQTEALQGRSVTDLIRLETGDFTRWFQAALTAEEARSRQQYYPDQTLLPALGQEHHSVHLSINTIADANDSSKTSGVLVVMEDISDEKRLKNTMYRYMTQELAEQLLSSGDARLGGDRKEVSVLFSDIRSYTTLTENMEAEEVVAMLNDYFETMVDAVFSYKGTLDKYIGDAIMAVYGSPLPLDDHAWMAVQTAIEMRHRLKQFNQTRPAHRQIRIGIGINSDCVISGNIGSSKRMEFTAIGDGVNLGSRLEGASKHYGCDIVISDNTYRLCADRVWVRELDRICVKGKSQSVGVYELMELRSNPLTAQQEQVMQLYDQGRQFYLNCQFKQAMRSFETLLQDLNPQDKAAQLHLKRCEHWLKEPPTAERWNDGVWTLNEK